MWFIWVSENTMIRCLHVQQITAIPKKADDNKATSERLNALYIKEH